jgi:hypothetical protein
MVKQLTLIVVFLAKAPSKSPPVGETFASPTVFERLGEDGKAINTNCGAPRKSPL